MHKVLDTFGFGPDLQKWIKVFYTNIKSTVIVGGHVSSWFEIQRGCRQGDPVSPYLFILCVEVLAAMIRENSKIKGITIFDVTHKLAQYADDTQTFLDDNKESFENCINTFQRFGKVSGLMINYDKTDAVW